MRLPGWETWSLQKAPGDLRGRVSKLKYLPEYHNICVCCGAKKSGGSTSTCDAGQAYEQTSVSDAVMCLIWCCAWVIACSGYSTVTVNCHSLGYSKLGGSTNGRLNFNSQYVTLEFVECCQMFRLILSLTLIRIGSRVWKAPGITIGNPFFRL